MADVKEIMDEIEGNLRIVDTYYKIYRAECEQGKRPAGVSQATDVLASRGIEILIEALRKTSPDYFAGAKRDILELYNSELTGCLKEINAACPNGADEPTYVDKEEMKRMYPKPGNVLADKIRKIIQNGWNMLP